MTKKKALHILGIILLAIAIFGSGVAFTVNFLDKSNKKEIEAKALEKKQEADKEQETDKKQEADNKQSASEEQPVQTEPVQENAAVEPPVQVSSMLYIPSTKSDLSNVVYKKYTNNRCGFAVEYPDTFSPLATPPGNWYQEFKSADDVWIVVSGDKINKHTLQGDYDSFKKSYPGMQIIIKTTNQFTVQYQDKGYYVVYTEVMGDKQVNSLKIKCPVELFNDYQAVMEYVLKSFEAPNVFQDPAY
jgi:hypothetical protein